MTADLSITLRSASIGATLSLALVLAACGGGGEDSGPGETGTEDTGTIPTGTATIEHARGTTEVPVNPDTVVALSNRDFTTLAAFGVELAAAPVTIMGDPVLWPEYADVQDVGNHREPNLEVIIAAEPDLIITGTRFSSYYDDLVADNPGAVVIDTTPSDESGDVGDDLKHYTQVLGQIFGKEDQAAQIITAYDDAVAAAIAAYDGESTVMGLITSGNAIQYAAPVDGRSVGPLFPILGLQPAIEREAEDTAHGDEISVEAIADANPDWIIVLDRDGAFGEDDYRSAQEILEGSEALQNVTAVSQGQIIYLDPTFYLTEDIQAYTALFNQIAEAFAGAE